MLHLPSVTLLGIDCVNVERLQLAMDICMREVSFGAVKLLTSLPTTDARVVPIPAITSIEAYSQFCLKELSAYVDTPHVLVVQHDGFILNPQAWQDAWLEFDYIGAPIQIGEWTIDRHGVPQTKRGSLVVGNGGFSLRSKKLLDLTAKLAAAGDFILSEPEDWAICYTEKAKLEAAGIRFAPAAVAERFSFEGRSLEYHIYKDSFGFHGLRWTDISRWLEQNPQYKDTIINTVTPDAFG
jgi:Protein of unknown function (DUF5672)